MSYTSERGSGVYQEDLSIGATNLILTTLGATSAAGSHLVTQNEHYTFNGKTYTLKNNSSGKILQHGTLGNSIFGTLSYNLYDVIAVAKAAGCTNTEIADAFNKASEFYKKAGDAYTVDYPGDALLLGLNWNNDLIKKYNQATTPAAKQVQEYLDANYPGAHVSVILASNGVDYIHRIVYKDPKTGENVVVKLPNPKNNNKYSNQEKSDYLTGPNADAKTKLDYFASTKETFSAAESQLELVEGAEEFLKGNSNVGSNATTNRTITAADIAAVKAAYPDISDLEAYNLANKYGVHNAMQGNLTPAEGKSELVPRTSLEKLQGYTDIINSENKNTISRDIANQRDQLISRIQRDPELYNAVISQFRNDTASGVTAGQRAARAGLVAQEHNTAQQTKVADLYSKLFTGDSAAAATMRDSIMKDATTALDTYIQSALNNANKAALDANTQAQDIKTAMDAYISALGVDASKYTNAAAESQAKADSATADRVRDTAADVTTQLAANDADLAYLQNLLTLGENYLGKSAYGAVSDAVRSIATAIKDAATKGGAYANTANGGFTKVDTPDYEEAKQFTDTEYNTVINNPIYKSYLDNIDTLTKSKSLDDILKEFGLIDKATGLNMLSEEGLRSLYEQNADTANKQSNQIFNEAQRAYIAAITAGDAQAVNTLTRLAQSTSGTKGNLYAASALASRYGQLSNALNSGMQLRTDVANQNSANAAAMAQSQINSTQALTKYLGNGESTYDGATLYGVAKNFDNAAATNRNSFGQLANEKMNTTANMNTANTNVAIGNADRLSQLANSYTDANAQSAANNITNAGTRQSLVAEVEALRKQAEQTLAQRYDKNKNKNN